MNGRIKRALCWIAVVLVTVVAVVIAVPSLRMPVLRKAGWALVAEGPSVQSADIIVLATDSEFPSALAASDLVHRGVSTRVAIFPSPRPWESEFVRRGVPFEGVEALTTRYLAAMGIADVEHISESVVGSEDEGTVLPVWCGQHNFKAVVVITTPDHSRRLSRILRRAMKGHRTMISVQATRYSGFDPDRWWETRDGVRTEIVEVEKLVLDVVRHPFS
jgi:hypothetical protein